MVPYKSHTMAFTFELFSHAEYYMCLIDILGPIDYLSDIENLVSFERAMFEDYIFKHKMKIFLLFMSISPLRNACLKHHEQCIYQK